MHINDTVRFIKIGIRQISPGQADLGPVSQNRLRREFVRSSQRCDFSLHLRTLYDEIVFVKPGPELTNFHDL